MGQSPKALPSALAVSLVIGYPYDPKPGNTLERFSYDFAIFAKTENQLNFRAGSVLALIEGAG